MKKYLRRAFIWEMNLLARFVYRRSRPYVIGITGSSGKTTTKYMIGELLRSVRPKVRISPNNMNHELGFPLSVLGYTRVPDNFLFTAISAPFQVLLKAPSTDFLVLEYASNKPGDLERLTKIIPPDVAVIVSIGVAHLNNFENPTQIASEKWEFAKAAKDRVFCTTDVLKMTKEFSQPKAEVIATGNISTVKTENTKKLSNKTILDMFLFGKKYKVEFSFFGFHNISNLELAVLATSLTTGEPKKIVSSIKDLKPLSGRGKRFIGRRGILILDESYNANPLSMLAALRVLEDIKYVRKVAILGEMKEIGSISEKSHKEIAKYAKQIADLTIGVGGEFRETGLDKWYPNVEELEKEIEDLLTADDTVLVKGSHSMNMKKIVNKLR